VTARAEAQCIRLGLLYALLDGATNIDLPHIKAALAVWEYCEASAAHIFGASLGDPVADEIVRALQHTSEGLSRTAIHHLFGRNQSADRIGAALTLLMGRGSVGIEHRQSGGGRPSEVWFATGGHRYG
jgi:queuine/archaeosine tRNA-ribosyltransferase